MIRIVSLFSGGGFAEEAIRLASERTGIACEVVMAVDSWEPAARVRDANFVGVRTTVRSVKEMTRADLPPHDLVIGGPPCQDHSLAGKRACSCNVGGPVAERCCLADFVRLASGSAWLMENVRPRLIRDGWSEQFCAADFGDVTSRKRWFYSSHLLHVVQTPGPRRFGDIRDHDADAKAIDKRGRYDPRRFGAKFGISDGEIPGSVCGNTHLGGGGTLVEIRPGASARIAADDDAILGSVTADSWHGTNMGGTSMVAVNDDGVLGSLTQSSFHGHKNNGSHEPTKGSMVAMRSYPQPYTEIPEDGMLGSVTSHTHDQPLTLKVGLRGHSASASAFEDDEVLGSLVSNSWHGNELGKLGPSVRCPSLLEMARAHSIPDLSGRA